MSELKLCSYCKSVPQANTWTLHGISETRYFCPNPECPHSVRTVTLEEWQTRPLEDVLQSRIAELENEHNVWLIGASNAVKNLETRIAELEAEVTRLLTESDDAHMAEARYIAKAELAKRDARIAELEEQVWELNLTNEKLQSAYFADETIAPDGTLKPSVSKLLKRLDKAETDYNLAESHVTALLNRIAKLEAEIDMLKQLSQPIEFWSDEKIQIYKSNESRTMKSGYEEREE